jgi:DtxR family Mn-dependent transcriptional regulator
MTKLLTAQAQDCLKAVHRLRQDGRVTTRKLAATLGLSDATVTQAVKRLAALGFLEHQPYRDIRLTPEGERLALEVIRHHRLLESYLHAKLGFTLEAAHEEAERLEHHISEVFEERISAALDHPTSDPQGEPIPARENGASPARLPRWPGRREDEVRR